MDPCSQGLLGASLACSTARNQELKIAALCGFVSGISADLDILIRSDLDTLLFLEYHRHFTHSLFFVPFGGFLISLILYMFFKNKYSFKKLYFYSVLGFFTHGLLDACTSYGTSIFWPFFEDRVAWNIISIIDPIFTFTLLIFLIIGILVKSSKYVRIGALLSLTYLLFCFLQHEKVQLLVEKTATERGHKIERILLNPTIANSILWRTIYQFNGKYYVDAVYVPLFGKAKIKNGVNIQVIDKEKIFPELKQESIQREDIRRFSFFSQDFIYLHPDYENIIADLRYGTLPNDHKSLWGIEIDTKNINEHAVYRNLREFDKKVYNDFWMMLNGRFQGL